MATEEDLFEAVGRGRVSAHQVLEAVFPGLKDAEREAAAARTRIEDGKAPALRARRRPDPGRLACTSATAARPVPGDRIVGILEPDGAA